MTTSSYIEKILTLREKNSTRSGIGLLNDLEVLNQEDWEVLLDDIVESRAEAFELLQPDRNTDLSAHAGEIIQRLSTSSKHLIARAINSLTLRRLRQDVSSATLFGLLRMLPELAEKETLLTLYRNSKIAEERKQALEILASNANTPLPISFWLGLNIKTNPELAPAILTALQSVSPILALTKLGELETAPHCADRLEYPLRISLRRYFSQGETARALLDFSRLSNPWIRQFLEKMLSISEFLPFINSDVISESSSLGILESTWQMQIESYLEGNIELSDLSLSSEVGRRVLAEAFACHAFELIDGNRWQATYSRLLPLASRLNTNQSLGLIILIAEKIFFNFETLGNDHLANKYLRESLLFLATHSDRFRLMSLGGDLPSTHLFELYMRFLRRAVGHRDFSELAYEQFLSHVVDRRDLLASTRIALLSGDLGGLDCFDALRRHYQERESMSVFMEILSEAAAFDELRNDGNSSASDDLITLGIKAYQIDPRLVASEKNLGAHQRMLIADAAAPNTTFLNLIESYGFPTSEIN